MDKKSGVYITLTDNSIATGGTQELKAIIPMLTTKGKLGLNKVTARNFKEIVGYDLDKNSNYYGLNEILSNVSYAYVWRLNQGATCANAYVETGASTVSNKTGVTSYEQFLDNEGKLNCKAVVVTKDVGDLGAKAVKFSRTMRTTTVKNNFDETKEGTKGSFEVEKVDVSVNNVKLVVGSNTVDFFGGAMIYDSSDSEMIGAIYDDDGTYKVIKCSSGIPNSKAFVFEDGEVSEVVDSEILGTATIVDGKLTVNLTNGKFNNDLNWCVEYFHSDKKDWKLEFADYEEFTATNVNTYKFSLDSESEIFIDNIDFGDLVVKGSDFSDFGDKWNELKEGNFGLNEGKMSVVDIDTSVLKTTDANFIFMNGITNYEIANVIAKKGASLKMHSFLDTPAYATYDEVAEWKSHIYNSEYVVVGSVVDKVSYREDYIYVYPSVKYCEIYANMMSQTGTLNYPPAGHTYGVASANNLDVTDFSYYGNELKTNRINYMVSDSLGTCMWEQRTTYSLNSDLSYIAPVFILDSVCDEMVSFERNFNFRYMSATQLMLQENGLTSILDRYVNNGFIWKYTLNVPTLEDVMAEGSRELNITVELQIAKDAEVITINVVLNK